MILKKPHIALVDDDENIVASVAMSLRAEGFEVSTYHDGEDGYHGILSCPPDLAVLDVKMPKMDGMELLQKLREHSHTPVIFLTSKSDEIDEVLGLRLGADDYIAKPFSQRLLIERIRSVLRRYKKDSAPTLASNPNKDLDKASLLIRGSLELDEDRHICRWKQKMIGLTVTEYLIVKALAFRPGIVKTRDQLITESYGESIYVDDRIIDTHIKRLRKKFKEADPDFECIETLYGLGYRFKGLEE
jgi:two-component system, OmpR family, response regulator ChvI